MPLLTVGSGFSDGDTKTYNPPKRVTEFPLPLSLTKPSTISAIFLLTERKNGNTDTALEQLIEFAGVQIKKAIEQPTNAAIVKKGLLGTIYKKVSAGISKYLVGTMTKSFVDKLFPLQTVSVAITGANHLWAGNSQSPKTIHKFQGHSGLYEVTYFWAIEP